jgi:hypothetical protein
VTLAEIMWRWTVPEQPPLRLVAFGLFEYLDTLPVTNGELLFLRSRQPYLVGESNRPHSPRKSEPRCDGGYARGVLLGTLWIVAASVGRIATVRALLDYFRRDVAGNVAPRAMLEMLARETLQATYYESVTSTQFPARRCGAGRSSLDFWGVDSGRVCLARRQSSTGARFFAVSAAGGTDLAGVVNAELAVVVGWHVCRARWAGRSGRDLGLQRTSAANAPVRYSRSALDGTGASGRVCRSDHGRFHAAGLGRHCARGGWWCWQ